MRSVAGLTVWFVVVFGVAALSARSRPGSWYASLRKPPWTPSGWVFAPVWGLLYAMMACAAWLVWRDGGLHAHPVSVCLFLLQLALNGAWSWLFFGRKDPGAAFGDIAALLCAILATTISFAGANRLAAGLLVPYAAWVSFASLLNLAIWRLNPGP